MNIVEFDRNLEDDVVSETSGDFRHLLVSECNAHRDDSVAVDQSQASKDAQAIFEVTAASVLLLLVSLVVISSRKYSYLDSKCLYDVTSILIRT